MSSKVVIKAMPNDNRCEKLFKIVKLVNYDSVGLVDTVFTENQVEQFLKTLNKRVSYEILGA
jgi:hypothetical protein